MESPSANDPSQEVSWQTCFFLLLTLGLNTMTQPCGTIFHFREPYRIYLRCSPIACVLDTVYWIIGIYSHSRRQNIPRARTFRELLAFRFRRIDGLEYGEGLQAASAGTWTRWFLFLLSALPAAVKLAGLHGVPWTQAFGLIFVVSWLEMELLIWLAHRDLDWLSRGVFDEPAPTDTIWEEKNVALATCIVMPLFWRGMFWVLIERLDDHPLEEAIWVFPYLAAVVCGLSCMRAVWLVTMKRVLATRLGIAKNLLVGYKDRDGNWKVAEEGLEFLGCFLYMILSTAVGYKVFYDPTGTVNPGWTAVFG